MKRSRTFEAPPTLPDNAHPEPLERFLAKEKESLDPLEVIPPTGAGLTQKADLPLPYLRQGARKRTVKQLPAVGTSTLARMNMDEIHSEIVQMATMYSIPELPYSRELLNAESMAIKPTVKPPHLEEIRFAAASIDLREEKPHWRDEREKSEDPEPTPQERASAEFQEVSHPPTPRERERERERERWSRSLTRYRGV